MTIANYAEFSKAIDKLFSSTSIKDVEMFNAALLKSREERKATISLISEEIKKLKLRIEVYKNKIKLAKEANNKKEYGKQLNEFLTTKMMLVRKYSEQKNSTPFSALKEDAKIYACTKVLLNKYILSEILSENFSDYTKNPDDSLDIDINAFLNSRLFQDAGHIRDYVSSYLENYPERVKGSRHFIGLHKNITNFSELLFAADKYFEKINEESEKELNQIKKSHDGIELFASFPEERLQAVKLLSKSALKYEGSIMKHCVATYAAKVEDNQTEIYSIRDLGQNGQELKPHATIEFKDGKIKQIKGPNDSLVENEYIFATRKLLMKLMRTTDFNDIINDSNLPLAEKNNIGIFKDINGKLHDVLALIDEKAKFDKIIMSASALQLFPLHNMEIKNLVLSDDISQNDINILSTAGLIEKINFSKLNFFASTLDLSPLQFKELGFDFNSADALENIILPENLESFSISGIVNKLSNIEINSSLKSLRLKGEYEAIRHLNISDNLEKLELDGKFSNLEEVISSDFQKSHSKGAFNKHNYPAQTNSLKILNLAGDYEKLSYIPINNSLRLNLSGKFHNVKKLEIPKDITSLYFSGSCFPQIEKLDLSAHKDLSYIDFMSCEFPRLKTLHLPAGLTDFIADHCQMPLVEDLDFSDIPALKAFGKLNAKGVMENLMLKIDFGTVDTEIVKNNNTESRIRGFSLNFANLGSLKKLNFPQDIEVLNFSGLHFNNLHNFELENYPNLQNLDLSFSNLLNFIDKDFSKLQKLREITFDKILLPYVKLPQNIEKIHIHNSKRIDCSDVKDYDFSGYKNLVNLETHGFLPLERNLPKSLKNIKAVITGNNMNDIKYLNFQNYDHAELITSFQTSFEGLEKISFPKKFEPICLFLNSPQLKELDFSNTVGKLTLGTSDYYDEIIPKNSVQIDAEQIKSIKKIKLGINQELELDRRLCENPNIIFEVHPESNTDYTKWLNNRYPEHNFVTKSNQQPKTNSLQMVKSRQGNSII